MKRAYVLLSGGIDSTTCLYQAVRDWPEVVGVSIFYGQRHKREIEHAKLSCSQLRLRHCVLDLSAVMTRHTMLTDKDQNIPEIPYSEIKGVSPTYVPFRNGLLLSATASFIQAERAEWDRLAKEDELLVLHGTEEEWGLYFGAHAEDAHAWAYPDCSSEFIGAMANAIYTGTYRQLRLVTPLEWLGKADIIRLGERLGVRWLNTWSCYKGEDQHCGTCPTCRARRDGFRVAGVLDPTTYAREVV